MMIAPMAQAKVIMSDGPAVLTLCHFYTAAPNAALRQSKVRGNSRLRPFGSGGSPHARISPSSRDGRTLLSIEGGWDTAGGRLVLSI